METLQLAYNGHQGQYRETRKSHQQIFFIVHPVGTARLTIKYFPLVEGVIPDYLETVICVALRHDLPEDTRTEEFALEQAAGTREREIVEALTKSSAGVIGKTKEERNLEIMDQIFKAGPTAVFVKLCDSIHNTSRQNVTPTTLYRKVVQKANDLYLSLLDKCPLGKEFEQIYRESLSGTEEQAAIEEKYSKQKSRPTSLNEVISECVKATTGKILELHDIIDILIRVCDTSDVTVWRRSGKDMDTLTQVGEKKSERDEQNSVQLQICDSPIALKGKAIRKFREIVPAIPYKTIFMIPMQIGPGRSFVVIIPFNPNRSSSWITLDSISMIEQYLAHRLILSESDRRAILPPNVRSLSKQRLPSLKPDYDSSNE